MAGEVAILLIDSNGLAQQTEQAFRPLDRYLLSLQRRARQLGRMRITPFIRLVDKASAKLNDLKNQLDAFSAESWTVNLDLMFDKSAFEKKGEEAGKDFKGAFLLGFSPDSIADKVKEAMKEVDLDIGVNISNNTDEKLLDQGLVKDIISGTAANLLSAALIGSAKAGYKKYKSYRTKPKVPPDGGGPKPTGPAASAAAPKPGNSKVVEMDAYKKSRAKVPNKIAKTSLISKVDKFVSSSMSSGFISHLPKLSLPKIPTSGLAKSALKLGGKMFRPLSVMTDVASISTAKPGKERNKAIGGALGGWGGMAAGAAIGSVVPIVGTVIGGAIGGLAGSFAGEWIGKNAGGVAKKASKWIGGIFGGKKKEKMDPVPAQPVTAIPTPSTQPANPRESATGRQQPSSIAIHVKLPVGAVQLKVEDNLNYDELSAIIGSKIAVSVQQAMENRV